MASVGYGIPVARQDEATRSDFIVKVYQHLLLAIGAFVVMETLLLQLGVAESMYTFFAESGGGAWLLILGGFMIVSWLATNAAHSPDSQMQYAGLFGMAAAYSLIFAPMLYYFFKVAEGGGTVWSAAVITGLGFAGLSAVGYTTRKDLDFLRPLLMWGGICALLLIVAAVLFGLELGVWFSLAMIALAGASILYSTQKIIRNYPADRYVGAAVELFGSIMLMFWYVLRLLGQMRN